MDFVSVNFILLFLVSSIIYYLFPKKFKWIVLLIANIIFYISGNGFISLFLLGSIITIYIGGRVLDKLESNKPSFKDMDIDTKKVAKKKFKNKKKLVLLLTIFANLGILVVLKYDNFLISIFNSIFNFNVPYKNFILPLGISYYTLEAISYIADIYNGKYKGEKNIFKLALYLSFFPLMVEGPISRYDELSVSLYEPHEYDFTKYKDAIILIIWGYLKKLVIADRVGILVDNVFNNNYGGIVVILAMVLYVVQIYTEFSGCMDIVTGVSELFGIKVPRNFNHPFFSKSIDEFWRRWHITLGAWLRDYIFYPLSISNLNMKIITKVSKYNNVFSKLLTTAYPLLIVWLTMGIWHGASFKYILYGLYYYVLMVLGILLKPIGTKTIEYCKFKTNVFSYKLFQMFRTTLLVTIGMTLFRSKTFIGAFKFMGNIFNTSTKSIFDMGLSGKDYALVAIMLVVIFIISLLGELGIDVRKKIDEQNIIFRYVIYLVLVFSLLTFGLYGYGYDASSFIYGGF